MRQSFGVVITSGISNNKLNRGWMMSCSTEYWWEWVESGSILDQGAYRVKLSNLHIVPNYWILLNTRAISYRLHHVPFPLCISYTQWNQLLFSHFYYDLPDSMKHFSSIWMSLVELWTPYFHVLLQESHTLSFSVSTKYTFLGGSIL